MTVNGENVRDIIDLSFAMADERLSLLVERRDGRRETVGIKKDYDRTLGVEFESAVFDKTNQCANKCVFCFVEQMPPKTGLRPSLYIKDDDYRLSFLYGNFITLTNLKPQDIARIRRLHLSPLYVSVHTMNGALRAKMMNNPQAALIAEQLQQLAAAGIDIHAQVVLCPGVNDGKELDYTIEKLFSLYPNVLSLAIVPVGLTRFRDNCPPLSCFDGEAARQVIAQTEKWRKLCRQKTGVSFVYPADEFYLLAGEKFPAARYYDGFPQLENGVGIVRSFVDEWQKCKVKSPLRQNSVPPYHLDAVCGLAAAPVLRELCSRQEFPGVSVRLAAVENEFFGKSVTVTGLLTGGDILKMLKKLPGPRHGVILPGVTLKEGDAVFLDGMTLQEFKTALACPVKVAYTAADLKRLLTEWQ